MEVVKLYSPKPRSFYTIVSKLPKPVLFSSISIGLGDTDIIQSDPLWNWLVLTSRLPFMWEAEPKNKKNLPARFAHVQEAMGDMAEKIHIYEIGDMMMTMTPSQVWRLAKEYPLDHLATCRFHKSESNLRFIIRARQAAWRVSQGLLTSREDLEIIKMARRQI